MVPAPPSIVVLLKAGIFVVDCWTIVILASSDIDAAVVEITADDAIEFVEEAVSADTDVSSCISVVEGAKGVVVVPSVATEGTVEV